MKLIELDIIDVPKDYKNKIKIHGLTIDIRTQKTGFGEKRFMICPHCGKRRVKLYYQNNEFYCRSCIEINVYKDRTSLDDYTGINIVYRYMLRIMYKAHIEFDPRTIVKGDFIDYIFNKPKYMHIRTYERYIEQLCVLDHLRILIKCYGKRFTATEIKAEIEEEFLDEYFDYSVLLHRRIIL